MSPSLFVSGLTIPFDLALVCLAKADVTPGVAPVSVAYHMQPAPEREVGDETVFAIVFANVGANCCPRPVGKVGPFET